MWGDGIFNKDRFKKLGIKHTKYFLYDFYFHVLNKRLPAIAFDFK